MKKITCCLLFLCAGLLSSTAQQELLDGTWVLDYVVVDGTTYVAPPLYSTTPPCLPFDYFPGISFGIDGTGEYEAFAVLTFNNWFHDSANATMTIDETTFTTWGAVTLGECDCICDLENLYLSTILAGDFTLRTFDYIIENISGTDVLTITTPEGDHAVFYNYVLATDELAKKPRVSIYPNPTKKLLHIDTENTTIETVNIFSITGTKVIRYTNFGPQSIDISQLANGLYFVEIISTDGYTSVQRFLKQ